MTQTHVSIVYGGETHQIEVESLGGDVGPFSRDAAILSALSSRFSDNDIRGWIVEPEYEERQVMGEVLLISVRPNATLG